MPFTSLLPKSLIALTAMIAVAAQAQYTAPYFGNLAPTQLWDVDTVGGADDSDADLRALVVQRGIDVPNNPSADTVQQIAAATQFQPSATRRQANIKKLIARIRAKNPASATALEQQFREQDIFAAIDQAVAPYGMSSNNVADAFTIWWINSWEASQGIIGATPDPQATEAVRKQALLAILASPDFTKFSDAQKQDMADEYILIAGLIAANMAYLAENRSELPAYQRSIAEAARAGGLDLNAMKLTKNGFVETKKTGDASDVLDDGTAIASNDDGLSAAQLALIVAAGGAGLGAAFLIGKTAGRKA